MAPLLPQIPLERKDSRPRTGHVPMAVPERLWVSSGHVVPGRGGGEGARLQIPDGARANEGYRYCSAGSASRQIRQSL